MRKLILAVMLLSASVSLVGISSASLYASGGKGGGGNNTNKIPASQVPASVMSSFKAGFPAAQQTEWEVTPPVYYGPTIYTASFKQNGQKWQANYYADGTLVSAYPKS